ncbi:MAG TPA: ABC transporter substrate-binding protein [Burkholderiaceae bacterium]|nr:ABC transporter substrate-binding protein [Burkholderiaceae bacterium]
MIRIGSPDLGTAGKPFPGGNPLAVVKANGWLEEEFAKDNVKIEWTFFRGAGPAVNEALSSRQLDVVFLGDLASVIGRARGLPTRLIAITGRGSNSYLAVAPGSDIRTFADLKGRKVSVLKGTAYQRPFDALLADVGLTEKDVRLVNLDWPTAKAAVVGKDVDATFGGADLHLLKDKGVTLPVSTKGRGPAYAIFASVLATEEFISKYSAATTRIARQIVRASQWASEEANRAALLALWGEHSGQGQATFQAEFDGENLRARHSPRVDGAAVAVYKSVVADALKLGLIKQNVDVDAWVAPQFVEAALKELKLENAWPRLNAGGKPQP